MPLHSRRFFPVLGHAATPSEPREGAFDHPAPRDDFEALHGIGAFDDLQRPAPSHRCRGIGPRARAQEGHQFAHPFRVEKGASQIVVEAVVLKSDPHLGPQVVRRKKARGFKSAKSTDGPVDVREMVG